MRMIDCPFTMRGLALGLGLCASLPWLVSGCVTEPRAAQLSAPAPAEIERLAHALMTYRATHGRLPETLDQLVDADLLPQPHAQALLAYAYAQGGFGALPDGRRVLLVDAHIREGDRAWCIVGEAARGEGMAQIEPVLVPMDVMRRIAGV